MLFFERGGHGKPGEALNDLAALPGTGAAKGEGGVVIDKSESKNIKDKAES